MNGPGYQPIASEDEWFVGEDQDIQWTISNRATRVIEPVTGWAATFLMGEDEGAVGVLSVDAIVADGPNGVLQCSFPESTTDSIDPGVYWYQLSRTDLGFDQVVAYGPVVLRARNQ